MLDGRVLGASQVEYKPFGKPPLQREIPGMQGFPALNSPHDLIQNCFMVDSCCRNIATKLRATCPVRAVRCSGLRNIIGAQQDLVEATFV